MRFSILRVLAVMCLLAAVIILGWSLARPGVERVTIPVKSEEVLAGGFPAQIELSYPETLRIGESVDVRINLPPIEVDGAPDAIQIEGRLELTGVELEPGSRLVLSAAPGRPVTLRWQVMPVAGGTARGMLWLYGPGEQRLPVLARPIQLEVTGFLGGPIWVGQGVAGLLAGAGGVLFWMSKRAAGVVKKRLTR